MPARYSIRLDKSNGTFSVHLVEGSDLIDNRVVTAESLSELVDTCTKLYINGFVRLNRVDPS